MTQPRGLVDVCSRRTGHTWRRPAPPKRSTTHSRCPAIMPDIDARLPMNRTYLARIAADRGWGRAVGRWSLKPNQVPMNRTYLAFWSNGSGRLWSFVHTDEPDIGRRDRQSSGRVLLAIVETYEAFVHNDEPDILRACNHDEPDIVITMNRTYLERALTMNRT